ncbi:hypothetical protein MiSe_93020 [Microseira wollei NIES-4236]|uniref:Uncharacterized protein n=1 Tax=Microseira wollei NIES-4236 TaxID=2530354 RepID=A0AAV3XRN5_9CYAN|nr:hypothetical protein MiSe_93020 [Microseira wollei NIES-4236]
MKKLSANGLMNSRSLGIINQRIGGLLNAIVQKAIGHIFHLVSICVLLLIAHIELVDFTLRND